MKKNNIIIISVTALIILGTAFYWYEWRPAEIRKSCSKHAGSVIGTCLEMMSKLPRSNGESVKKCADIDTKQAYKFCLQRKGLKE